MLLAFASMRAASTALASVTSRRRVSQPVRAREVGEQLVVDVGGDDAGAFAHERFGGGAADALAGGGDEGGLAGESIGHGEQSPQGVEGGARRWPRPDG